MLAIMKQQQRLKINKKTRHKTVCARGAAVSGLTTSNPSCNRIILPKIEQKPYPKKPVVAVIIKEGSRDGRFGSKVGQIGPKWDKSGAFSDQISVHLAPQRQMH